MLRTAALLVVLTGTVSPALAQRHAQQTEQSVVAWKPVDLAFQLVEERDDAISLNTVKWLPDFIKEVPEAATRVRVNTDSYGTPVVADDKAILEQYIEWLTPRCSMVPQFAVGREILGAAEKEQFLLYVLEGTPWLTQYDVADARVDYSSIGEPYVQLAFTADGTASFAVQTGKNVNRKLAIMIDGEVVSAPVIREEIAGGRAQITLGSGPPGEQLNRATDLVNRLTGKATVRDMPPARLPHPEADSRVNPGKIWLHVFWTLAMVPGVPAGYAGLFVILF